MIGARVRLACPPFGVALRSDTGTVIRPAEWDGYWIVRLDEPATYSRLGLGVVELSEIREADDNLIVLDTETETTT